MQKVSRAIQKAENFLCISLLSLAFIIILAHIIGRYLFKYPLFFAEEISRYAFIWAIMLGASVGLRSNSHTRVEYFVNFLPPKARIVSTIIVKLGIIGFLLLVTYFGIYLVSKTMDIPTAAMEWPWGLVYLAAPVGCVSMIVTSALQVVDDFRRLGLGSR